MDSLNALYSSSDSDNPKKKKQVTFNPVEPDNEELKLNLDQQNKPVLKKTDSFKKDDVPQLIKSETP